MPKPLNLIVACTENRVIGRDRRLPFDLPEDKAWFHEKTAGNVVVLGRTGFEIWPHVLADGRRPVVVSSRPDLIRARIESLRRARQDSAPAARPADRVRLAASVPEALSIAQSLPGEIMICGGQRIYEETLPLADRLLLTLVHTKLPGDTWFPEWRHLPWRETWRRESADASHRYTFSVLERVR
jgi:dihydrofolate reductase